jgi:hypothetical protein
MAYGLQVFNSSGQSILDTTSDKQGIGQVSGSAAISTNSSGVGNSSAISFAGIFTINITSSTPSSTITVKYVGLEV